MGQNQTVLRQAVDRRNITQITLVKEKENYKVCTHFKHDIPATCKNFTELKLAEEYFKVYTKDILPWYTQPFVEEWWL